MAEPISLLLLPERQQSLRGRASDHARNAYCHLSQRRRRDATKRDRADADLSPEVEIAPAVRALGLELVHSRKRVLAQRCDLHGVSGLDHFSERRFDGRGLLRQFAAKIFTKTAVADRITRQGIARHASDRQLVDGVPALAPRQHLQDALNWSVRTGCKIVSPERVQ